MTDTVTTYVSVAVVTAAIPASLDAVQPPGCALLGLGLLIAEQRGRNWRFARRAKTISTHDLHGTLLEWAAERLPSHATLIGWNVDHAVIPALLDAASSSPPEIAHRFVGRLHDLLNGGAVDVSLEHGGAAAPPLAVVAADMAIFAPARCEEASLSAWTNGQVEQLRHDLADEALAIWRVFLRTAGLWGIDAEAATDEWVERRRHLRAVERAVSEGSS